MCKEERSYSKVCLVPRPALKFHAMLFDYRCFTFGIGSGASTDLVEGLAKAGGGTSEFVKEGERMQAKVSYGTTKLGEHIDIIVASWGYCNTIRVAHRVTVTPVEFYRAKLTLHVCHHWNRNWNLFFFLNSLSGDQKS